MAVEIEFLSYSSSDQSEFWNAYVKAQIREIITVQNHSHKYPGFKPTKEMILQSIDHHNLNISIITETNGSWYFMGTDEELSRLPKILPLFKRLYRFQRNKHDL